MIVVGGCYRELCDSPHWDAVLGSGGRAAIVLAALADDVCLHTYRPKSARDDLYSIEVRDVKIVVQPSSTELVFSYFHPLSSPIVLPKPIPQEKPLIITGETVLRFGLLEGDAIVSAKCAVYDPQSSGAQKFSQNGSKAEKLAIVVNESELVRLGESGDLPTAAKKLMTCDRAEIVVAKCGVKGAWIFSLDEQPQWISAYRSSSVFKIGTGDVFSAVFSHYWGACNFTAVNAAKHASQFVANYAATRSLSLSNVLESELVPTNPVIENVTVIGDGNNLAYRWLREEAVSRLLELGVTAQLGAADIPPANGNVLLLADSFDEDPSPIISRVIEAGLFLVVFQQSKTITPPPGVSATDDFTTALYFSCWGRP